VSQHRSCEGAVDVGGHAAWGGEVLLGRRAFLLFAVALRDGDEGVGLAEEVWESRKGSSAGCIGIDVWPSDISFLGRTFHRARRRLTFSARHHWRVVRACNGPRAMSSLGDRSMATPKIRAHSGDGEITVCFTRSGESSGNMANSNGIDMRT
jgi:hypothetical protein